MSHENKKAKMSNEKSPTASKMTVRMSLHELEEPENSNRKNNFLKAWKRIKELPPTNPNSLWSIATFHGMPFKNDHQNHSENTKVVLTKDAEKFPRSKYRGGGGGGKNRNKNETIRVNGLN